MKLRYSLIIFSFLLSLQFTAAQTPDLNVDKWVKALSDKDYRKTGTVNQLLIDLNKVDSTKVYKFLDELAEKGRSEGYHFQVRYNILKATVIFTRTTYYILYKDRKSTDPDSVKEQIMKLYASAIDMAYRSEDDYLVAHASYYYGSSMIMFGEIGLAVMYAKNGIDLYEKLGYPIIGDHYRFLAELLYKVREYDGSIYYGKKSISGGTNGFTISSTNTVALGYHRKKAYDSALIYYNQALELAKQLDRPVWIGIVSGNMGQLFYVQGKYDTAYALLKMDHKISKDSAYYDNAANSLQWAARVNLARGNKAEALKEAREAFALLKLWPDANYLRNTYYTATQIFREMGNYDSAFYYNNLYSAINDSLEKVVATSSLAISQAKLNDETSRYNIQSLNRKKSSELMQRNFIIAGIIIFSFAVLLMVNSRRLKQKMRMEKAEQEKQLMEQEVLSAKNQLKLITANIIEKTDLIEKLEQQALGKQATAEQQTIMHELSQQTILTEDDWLKFKTLFEKIQPGFFINLKEKFPDITVAELRMAALIRLHLTTKQMASMLGISIDSVHKTRQRLRQRLQLSNDASLDEIVTAL